MPSLLDQLFVYEGDYPIFGKLPQTLITTNIEGITHG